MANGLIRSRMRTFFRRTRKSTGRFSAKDFETDIGREWGTNLHSIVAQLLKYSFTQAARTVLGDEFAI